MSYLWSVLADKPQALYMMDDSTPFQDYSGYNRTGDMSTGTVTTGAPLVAGALFSSICQNTAIARFDTPVYVQGYEAQEFSLEANVRVIDETAGTDQKILSTVSNYDGLRIQGTTIKFSTKYATAGEALVTYDMGIKRNVHVVGVHTYGKNQLFVDGVLVGEVDITTAQQADTYVTTDGKLYCGTCTGSQKIAVNGLAIYSVALTTEAIQRHVNAARRTTLRGSVAQSFGGVRFPMSLNSADVYLSKVYESADDWNLGVLTGTVVVNSQLRPQLNSSGVSIASTWLSVVGLDSGGTSIHGLMLTWDARGAVVEVSLDGTTWETAVQGQRITLITPGYNPTNKDLWLRVTFAGGVTDDPSYIDNLVVTGLLTGNIPIVDGRTTALTSPAAPMIDYQPIEFRDNFGCRLTGGTITISTDGSGTSEGASAENKFAINIWLKKLTGTDPTISVTGTGYVDGVAGNTMNQGQWHMRTIVAAANISSAITISGQVQVGAVELYNSQLTAQNVADIFTSSLGVLRITAPESDTLTITNPNPNTKIYDYDWSIGAGG